MANTCEVPSELVGADNVEGKPQVGGKPLTVADVMSKEIVTARRHETLFLAAKRMSENNVSCLVVVEEENLAGILTDKDMLRGVAIEDTDFRRMHVGEFMTSPVEVAPPQTTVLSAGEIMETKGIKRLPIVDDHTLVGLVTQTDITRGLVSISPLTSVSGIMTNDVATVDTTATVAQAAQAMSASGISCVVAIHRQTIAGIVTEKDMLRRVVALHKDPATTKIADIMSFPVVTISPAFSVLSAGKKLDQMHLHHVVVTDGNRVCGIVTQTDIMQAVRAELQRLEQQRRTLASELDSLTRYIMRDVARLRNLVSDAAGIPDNPTNEVQLARPGRPGAPPEAIESQAADPSGRD